MLHPRGILLSDRGQDSHPPGGNRLVSHWLLSASMGSDGPSHLLTFESASRMTARDWTWTFAVRA
jgi:hypothetical protein